MAFAISRDHLEKMLCVRREDVMLEKYLRWTKDLEWRKSVTKPLDTERK